jgi:group I intron endonuclease
LSCGIYKITNRINNKLYIGQAVDIAARWNAEKWLSKSDRYGIQTITRAIHKYGLDNFTFEILEETSIDRLNTREKYWISYFNSNNPEKGYNLTPGGQDGHSGVKRSSETCHKISAALKGKSRPLMKGKPSGASGKKWSIISRKRLSESLKGHSHHGVPRTEESKKMQSSSWTTEMRQAAAERARNQPKTTGWHHSDAAKKKMSESKKGKPATNKDIPRTEAQKLNDRIIALKRHLAKGKSCLRFTDMQKNIRYFVSEYEAATQLTGEFSPATLIARMTNNPLYVPMKKSSLGWKILQGCQFETCSQLELLEHRPELK